MARSRQSRHQWAAAGITIVPRWQFTFAESRREPHGCVRRRGAPRRRPLLFPCMNQAHLHLLVNHLPVVGSLFAFALLGAGLLRRNLTLTQAGLVAVLAAGLLGLPAQLSGAGAAAIAQLRHRQAARDPRARCARARTRTLGGGGRRPLRVGNSRRAAHLVVVVFIVFFLLVVPVADGVARDLVRGLRGRGRL